MKNVSHFYNYRNSVEPKKTILWFDDEGWCGDDVISDLFLKWYADWPNGSTTQYRCSCWTKIHNHVSCSIVIWHDSKRKLTFLEWTTHIDTNGEESVPVPSVGCGLIPFHSISTSGRTYAETLFYYFSQFSYHQEASAIGLSYFARSCSQRNRWRYNKTLSRWANCVKRNGLLHPVVSLFSAVFSSFCLFVHLCLCPFILQYVYVCSKV